jgi:hypothetical protein
MKAYHLSAVCALLFQSDRPDERVDLVFPVLIPLQDKSLMRKQLHGCLSPIPVRLNWRMEEFVGMAVQTLF